MCNVVCDFAGGSLSFNPDYITEHLALDLYNKYNRKCVLETVSVKLERQYHQCCIMGTVGCILYSICMCFLQAR